MVMGGSLQTRAMVHKGCRAGCESDHDVQAPQELLNIEFPLDSTTMMDVLLRGVSFLGSRVFYDLTGATWDRVNQVWYFSKHAYDF